MTATFRCGHPRTPENSRKNGVSMRCRRCQTARRASPEMVAARGARAAAAAVERDARREARRAEREATRDARVEARRVEREAASLERKALAGPIRGPGRGRGGCQYRAAGTPCAGGEDEERPWLCEGHADLIRSMA